MTAPSLELKQMLPGDPAPGFALRAIGTATYNLTAAAGRYIVLCFLGSAADPEASDRIAAMMARPDLFDDDQASLYPISTDPEDETRERLRKVLPGYRPLWDFERTASSLYGAAFPITPGGAPIGFMRKWVVIDPAFRIVTEIPFRNDRSDIAELLGLLAQLPPPGRHYGIDLMAPVLFLPRVFEPDFCRTLIDAYEADGGKDSGFMREIDGRTVGVSDHSFKRRRDFDIEDKEMILALQTRIVRRIVPEIAKAYQFHVTRMERYIVSCYSAEDGSHFSAHRDNTTKGTAHRRFAVSINLNDDFEGGEVSFPEFGPRGFKAPAGGAVVFSCSLLHQVSKVTKGRRFAFLPFLYDNAAAAIRQRNLGYLDNAQPAADAKADAKESAGRPEAAAP